ncbi:hypothetical protein FM105_07830 [Brevibacterium yomogidense]|uniref:Uncharacterized protein n=1 Tax=Brevibacterium yomogidense TaxID=946573 RepID=A0A1X6XFF5_9MICO|nr:hypothetical protein FM105_07830 [Brevibacterium yomogidense]
MDRPGTCPRHPLSIRAEVRTAAGDRTECRHEASTRSR